MTPLQWFNSYVDAVDFAHFLLQCETPEEANGYALQTLVAYEGLKGAEYATSVQSQAGLFVEGVRVLREAA